MIARAVSFCNQRHMCYNNTAHEDHHCGGCPALSLEMSDPRLLLASQSPRRYELLRLLGLPFEVTAADVDETPRADETPAELVCRLSRAMADGAQLLVWYDDTLVIGCDTVVALRGDILGKPRSADEAGAMLHRLRGHHHHVHSAVTLLDRFGQATTQLAETRLTMRAYSDAEIQAYVTSGDPLDKAGAYAIQHEGFHPVAEIKGCYASVMGLPLCHLARGLREWGIEPATDLPTACQAHTDHQCVVYQEIL
jgi:septum formation protein